LSKAKSKGETSGEMNRKLSNRRTMNNGHCHHSTPNWQYMLNSRQRGGAGGGGRGMGKQGQHKTQCTDNEEHTPHTEW